MLDFMVIALPRSGTTWAANWLTTESIFCAHDPLWTTHYNDFDEVIPQRAKGRLAGISCTAIWRWPHWLSRHPARKLILHRDVDAVRKSMIDASLPPVGRESAEHLHSIEGTHVTWTDLFEPDRASMIWGFITDGLPFDNERHRELTQLCINPKLDAVDRDFALNRKLGEELGIKPLDHRSPLEIRFGMKG